MIVKKKTTKEQALGKLAALCSQSEYCTADLLEKLRKWEIDASDQAEIIAYLVKERYVDDARFARFFVNDKLRFNKWGLRKVEMALRQKQIPPSVSDAVFAEIDDTTYEEVLLPLLEAKWKTTTGRNDYERSMKLIRFAMGRGFDLDIIRKCIDKMTGPEAAELSDDDPLD